MRMQLKRTKIWKLLRCIRVIITSLQNKYRLVRLSPIISRIGNCPDFPASSGSNKQWLDISLDGFENTIPILLGIVEGVGGYKTESPSLASTRFKYTPDVSELRQLFDFYGSDKGSRHNYDLIYAGLMQQKRHETISIFEIGLGTNNDDIPSNMGKAGSPGASLRAWKAYFTKSQVWGCDIDSRILFSEERIWTHQLDQTDTNSWNTLKSKIGNEKFDLVIDDGLHTPLANLVALQNVLPLLKNDGWLVIEDVAERAIPIWNLLKNGIANKWNVEILETNRAFIVLVQPKIILKK